MFKDIILVIILLTVIVSGYQINHKLDAVLDAQAWYEFHEQGGIMYWIIAYTMMWMAFAAWMLLGAGIR